MSTISELDALFLGDTTDLLSPSSVTTFKRCQGLWYLKKIEGLTERPGSPLTFGSAFDTAISTYFDQKLAGNVLEPRDVAEEFVTAWAEKSEETDWSSDKEDRLELNTRGQNMAASFVEEIGSKLTPVEPSQKYVELDLGDFRVRGYVDLVATTEDGQTIVADVKTSGTRYDANEITRSLQATVYTEGCGIDEFAFLVAVKNKTKRVNQWMQGTVTPEKVAGDLAEITRVRQHMQLVGSGAVEPILSRADVRVCSKRSCSLWKECAARWGGEIAD